MSQIKTVEFKSLHRFEQNFYQQWYELSQDVQQVIVWTESYCGKSLLERIPKKFKKYSSMDREVELMHLGPKWRLRVSPKQFKKHELEKLIYLFEKLFWGFECKIETSTYLRKTGKKIYEKYELILTKQKD